jgi:hypothetical protein
MKSLLYVIIDENDVCTLHSNLDDQAADMHDKVIQALYDALKVTEDVQQALLRYRRLTKNPPTDPSDARNQLGKVANLLGIDLTGFFF